MRLEEMTSKLCWALKRYEKLPELLDKQRDIAARLHVLVDEGCVKDCPECQTCGDTQKVMERNGILDELGLLPCPDCAPKVNP